MSQLTSPEATQPTTAPQAPTAPEVGALLAWTDALAIGDARMDDTHEEFITLLNDLLATPEDQQLPPYRAFIEHTVEHFAQEERWMLATGFAPGNCHAGQHATILETMNAVVERHQQGDTEIITRLAQALAEWFPQHALSMDAGLAQHLKNVGFDSATETLADPSTVRPAEMSGCGSVSCS